MRLLRQFRKLLHAIRDRLPYVTRREHERRLTKSLFLMRANYRATMKADRDKYARELLDAKADAYMREKALIEDGRKRVEMAEAVARKFLQRHSSLDCGIGKHGTVRICYELEARFLLDDRERELAAMCASDHVRRELSQCRVANFRRIETEIHKETGRDWLAERRITP